MEGAASSDRLVTTFPLLETVDLLKELSLVTDTIEAPRNGSKAVYNGNRSLEHRKVHGLYGPSPASVAGGSSKAKPVRLPNGCDSMSSGPDRSHIWGCFPSPGYQDMRFAFDRTSNLNAFPYHMNSDDSQEAMNFSQSSLGYADHLYSNHGMYGYDSWKHARGWYPVDSYRQPQISGYGRGYGEEKPERLNELCRGPRSGDYKNPHFFQTLIMAEAARQDIKEQEGDAKPYNGEAFPETYENAKFFVIKSYSEDDVHESIKNGVWSSTPNGNKKLDAAYREAKEIPNGCPVFLLFSVNASGQFVGLAEMIGPVDFNKTVGFWQQDKWIGCFPVKWHIVKDVPNCLLRHIILVNNDNKPVTNSRDTQEVNVENGSKIIKIFKEHTSKTCILDDYGFYEARAKIIHERKTKPTKRQPCFP